VGEHEGYARYTIGQRRGLPGGFAEPMYVVNILPEERAVVIGPREALIGRGLEARELNWLADAPAVGARVQVQVRHRAHPVPATVVRLENDAIELALEEGVHAITPGQSLVLFDGEHVLGGGVIEQRVERGVSRRLALPIFA
jgi:tRNA-specific 2-thiouridylase